MDGGPTQKLVSVGVYCRAYQPILLAGIIYLLRAMVDDTNNYSLLV